uniref:Metallophosphoesterase n=1 Tax=uncultured bacterium Contig13 TaxID=1393410 RepID=W0FPA6_9BACT|nr:metallophosphoesterase [uncultured bacterium Contig13]
MSLFAIGDLHLHFQSELKAPGQLHEPVWRNHEAVFRQNCEKLVKPDDTLVLVGDHSWGRKLPECEKDLEYICGLPGKKILLRGNHDMFWDAKKTDALNQQYAGRLFFLQNNCASFRDCAIVGTKGYTFEGPFYMRKNRIVGWDRDAEQSASRLVAREAERLRISFESAKKDGFSRFIMFLHYPPTNVMERNSVFTAIAEEYGAEQVIYAHCHGERRFHDSLEGRHHGVLYRLVSGDYLKWMPLQIL